MWKIYCHADILYDCSVISANWHLTSNFTLTQNIIIYLTIHTRFAELIQRCWRRYRSSRELVSLQTQMCALYAEQCKTRRRDSIYCPFSGDSLHQVGASYGDESGAGGGGGGNKGECVVVLTCVKLRVCLLQIVFFTNCLTFVFASFGRRPKSNVQQPKMFFTNNQFALCFLSIILMIRQCSRGGKREV